MHRKKDVNILQKYEPMILLKVMVTVISLFNENWLADTGPWTIKSLKPRRLISPCLQAICFAFYSVHEVH